VTRTLDDANREITRVRQMPYGLARTQAAERQVRLVDAEGPDAARAYALSTLVEAYQWGGEVDRSFVAFARLLRWWDEHPEHFDAHDRHGLFWSFKWMISGLADFPTVPAEQIDRTLADMERRYALAGNGMDAVAYERFAWARQRGAADVEAAYQTWVATPRDDFSQCEACDPGDRAAWLLATDRAEEGIRIIEQTLAEDPSCASEPADMLSYLAEAYLDQGRPRDAARTHRRAVAALAEAESDMVGARGRRVRLLARGGQAERAVRAIEADQQYLTGGDTPYSRLAFARLVGGATHVLREAGHGDLPVRLTSVPAATVAELDDWLRSAATALARRFDARNGTTAESESVARAWATEPAGDVLDLDVLPRGLAGRGGAAAAAASTAGAGAGAGPAGGAGAGPAGGAGAGAGPAGDAGPDAGGGAGPAGDARRADPADPAALVAEAERLAGAGDLESAAGAYLDAAVAFEGAGLLTESGFGYAEAAHCAQVLGDDDGAASGYAAAVARLRAADVPATVVAPVVVAWAGAAAVTGQAEAVLAEVDGLLLRLSTAGSPEEDDRAPELVAREQAEHRRAAADLDDAAARLLATLGGPERSAAAAARAQSAAEAYAGLGALGDAAHAFWLAGRLHDGLGSVEDAVWHLESAMEGFAAARQRGPHGEVANALVDVLRRSGQDARADDLARTLTS
jgi:tetratricopeptide (TPR) repeat protein